MSTQTPDLHDKICLITGANSGIGKATALALAQMGATVVMVCRDQVRGEAAQREIRTRSGNEHVDLLLADLSSQASIRQLAQQFRQRYSQLHILINNAGVVMLRRAETADGLELMFAVNTLAPFLLTNLLLDLLQSSAPARIINVSSDAHQSGDINIYDLQSRKKRYSMMRVYGQSKLALILWSYELARRLEGTGVTVNTLHPGVVATNIAKSGMGPLIDGIARAGFALIGTSPEKGAQTPVYLASSPDVEGVTGHYFEKSRPKKSHPLTYDTALQQKVWEASEKLVQRNDD